MDKIIALGGNVVGLAGVLLTVVAGVGRIMGHYHLAGFEIMTLFVGGMGLMLIGSFAKLYILSNPRG
jgi:type IV secretory pathway VirB2 component (pilin)